MDPRRHKEVKSLTMDTKKLDAFLLAVERGSLTAAASEMGYTQSGLTNMMNALENELGLKLLTRNKSGVGLTAEGQALQVASALVGETLLMTEKIGNRLAARTQPAICG